MKKREIEAGIEALKQIDLLVSEAAEKDPLEALFIVKNLKVEQGFDEKPLLAKILLQIAGNLDLAIRQNYIEKARILKSLLLKLIDELDVKELYNNISIQKEKLSSDPETLTEELLEEAPLQECLNTVQERKIAAASVSGDGATKMVTGW